ncbi:MAG: universal stress protein, partial [Bdellovibrionota bacterium]
MNEAKCVLWAVDPWEKSETPSMSEVRRLARAARREGLPLIPVHVVSVSEPQWERGKVALIPEIQAELELYLRRFSISHAEPRVIVDESGNRAGAVRALLDLAKQEKAAWIMVSSHGKTGMARLMLGSFAENLVKHSRLPLFFLPRQALRPTTRASRVALFPTDLSPAAHVAFTRFLDVALSQRLEIAILHELSTPIPSFDAGLGPVFPQNFDGEQKQWAQKAGAALVEEARRHGVKARFALDS